MRKSAVSNYMFSNLYVIHFKLKNINVSYYLNIHSFILKSKHIEMLFCTHILILVINKSPFIYHVSCCSYVTRWLVCDSRRRLLLSHQPQKRTHTQCAICAVSIAVAKLLSFVGILNNIWSNQPQNPYVGYASNLGLYQWVTTRNSPTQSTIYIRAQVVLGQVETGKTIK